MGSERLGAELLKHDRARYHLCGHAHAPYRQYNGHIECITIGSTYERKELVTLEVNGDG
jgi:hypothetical protein